jgi:hypothetical protein
MSFADSLKTLKGLLATRQDDPEGKGEDSDGGVEDEAARAREEARQEMARRLQKAGYVLSEVG